MTMPGPMAHGGDCAAPRHRAGRSRAESLSQLGGSTPCVSCTHRGARARREGERMRRPSWRWQACARGPGAGRRKVPSPRLVRADRSPCRASAKRRLGRYRCIATAPDPERREACVRCAPCDAGTVCSRRRAARLQGPFPLRLPHRGISGRGEFKRRSFPRPGARFTDSLIGHHAGAPACPPQSAAIVGSVFGVGVALAVLLTAPPACRPAGRWLPCA